MLKIYRFFIVLLLISYQACSYADINQIFERLKTNPPKLYAFLKAMPKGGELHYHLAGGAYPELMLNLAKQDNYCLDKLTFMISQAKACVGSKAKELLQRSTFYNQTLHAWSLKNFKPGKESAHHHFFASFFKFHPIVIDHGADLLVDVMQRAADQHEHYLEVIILPDDAKSTKFAKPIRTPNEFSAIREQLLVDPAFQTNIKETIQNTAKILQHARQKLGCQQQPNQAACQLTVKFQYLVLREQNLAPLFAQALNGFAAAAQSKDLVAVNLVQAEDGVLSLQNYHEQMQVFAFLRRLYPTVHLSLHAGELNPEKVSPHALTFHINEAVNLAKAERIGHGVDIRFEHGLPQLLQTMVNQPIPVEINLTSNEKLLNIAGKEHPLHFYLKHKVPVVLSTDDEGLLRTNLTHEYVKAALNQGLDYPTLKMLNRNALTYSFLPGASLWADAYQAKPIRACQDLNSVSCLEFIKTSEKAQLQRQLEKELQNFEEKQVSTLELQ